MKSLICAAVLAALPAMSMAEDWTLDGSASHLGFASIKKDFVGESHSFSGLTGTVDAEGMVNIEIDLTTVETMIDIRNERMLELVFGSFATATLSTVVDMEALQGLAVGEAMVMDLYGTVTLLGIENEVFPIVHALRVSDTQVMGTSEGMSFLRADDAGLMPGIDKLMELAALPSITRAVPVTFRFMFTSEGVES